MKQCPISHCCDRYSSGDNKPPNEHVRVTIPCVSWVAMTCDMGVELEMWLGHKDGIACDLNKINKIKESVKNKVDWGTNGIDEPD